MLVQGAASLPAAAGRDVALRILQEGRQRKFIDHVGEVKFSGERGTGAGRPVLHLPECGVRARGRRDDADRAAPGVDLRRAVLARVASSRRRAEPLKTMPAEISEPGLGSLYVGWPRRPI
jgi:propionate CoA-transferase